MSARGVAKPVLTTVITDGRAIGMILSRGLAGYEAWTADEKSLGLFMSTKDAHAAIVAEVATS
jgi:hypothetical protein